MSELMNISVNGQSQVPPGFRFHPTEEELLHYYLRKKISHKKVDLDVIHEVDLNKLEPWDIQERCKIGTTAQTDWYFFSHKDKKYPSGTRTNRATAAGFWKATGRDKVIYSSSSRNIIGMRKTLVFYTGRAPHGQKSDWIMYEYRLIDDLATNNKLDSHCQQQVTSPNQVAIESCQEEGWVVCRISKKRNHQQKDQLRGYKVAEPRPKRMPNYSPSEEEEEEEKKVDTMMNTISFNPVEAVMMIKDYDCFDDQDVLSHESRGSDNNIIKWAAVDQLVACQLNGQTPDHDHHKELHFQAFSSLTRRTNHSEICSLWGLI